MTFCYLDKTEKDIWLPRLFDLLYENMKDITPSDLSYEQERSEFLANVSPALDKEPRQILMGFIDGELACYVQCYTRKELLMVEEFQIQKRYQGTTLFLALCRRLLGAIPAEVRTVEAYADPRNRKSLELMRKLGMAPVSGEEYSPFIHLRGDAAAVKGKLMR